MTTRGQILRSSVTGNVPAAGTRLPGELWVNFPDLQMGVIDAAKNAQKLVAVRFFSTTANYAANDVVVQAGAIYFANGAITAGAFTPGQWTKLASISDLTSFGANYLPIAGGTLTGDLVLNRDPQVALGSATKQYVDGKVSAAPFLPIAGGTLTGKLTLSGPPSASLDAATKAYVDAGAFVPVTGGANTGLNNNRIINGDMRIDQRNNGASGTATGYTIDRWFYGASQASKGTWQKGVAGANLFALGFPNFLSFTSSSAYSVLTTDAFTVRQPIEADMISDFAWGTANAQPVTLSFLAMSSLAATFGGAISNAAPGTRSCPFSFTLAANTWTKIAVTIPGDTASGWTLNGNGVGAVVWFDLGSGANFRSAAGAWAAGDFRGATGAVSVVGTNGATFYVTGVKLEIGSVATPYNRQSLAKSMADCQRYYQVGNFGLQGTAIAGGSTVGYEQTLAVVMRASPTMVIASEASTTNMAARSITADSPSHVRPSGTAANNFSWLGTFTASAEL